MQKASGAVPSDGKGSMSGDQRSSDNSDGCWWCPDKNDQF